MGATRITRDFGLTRNFSQTEDFGKTADFGKTTNFGATDAPVAVPDVVGDTQADGSTAITGAGFLVGNITYAFSESVAAGLIISSTPVAGAFVSAGSPVDIVVSLGSESGGDPFFANVKALLHFNGADGSPVFVDVIGHTVTAVGAAAQETTGALYGSASMALPDVTDGCNINHADMALGAGEWTIEGSFKLSEIPPNDPDGYGVLCGVAASDADANGVVVYVVPNLVEDPDFGALSVSLPGSGSIDSEDSVIERDVLTHIAITKNAANRISVWIHGVEVDFTTNANAPTTLNPKFFVGAFGALVGCKGLFDEWRLTPGVCRYTAPFTPSPPYPDE